MKKIYLLMSSICLGSCLLMTGCVENSEVEANSQLKNEDIVLEQSTQLPNSERPMRDQQEGNILLGQVQKVVGNEVTLQIMEMDEEIVALREEERAAMKDSGGMQGMGAGGMRPENGAGMDLESLYNVTGETKVLTIPVGIPIVSINRGEEKVMDLSAVQVGKMIKIAFASGQEDVIENVMIMGAQ